MALKVPRKQNMEIPTPLSQENRMSSHYVCEFRECYPVVRRQQVYNCLSLSVFEVFFFLMRNLRHTQGHLARLVKNTTISTYSLSHKSSILWLCIYDTWPLFLPCGSLLRDNRGLWKYSASFTGNISHIPLHLPTHQVTEIQSGRECNINSLEYTNLARKFPHIFVNMIMLSTCF